METIKLMILNSSEEVLINGNVPEALPVVQINQKTGEAIRRAELKAI